jgi:hypothetical protein
MTTNGIELFNEYNSKAMETLRAFGDLSVSNVQWFIDKQVQLNSTLMQAGVEGQKEIAAAKTPTDAAQSATKLMQTWADSLTGFVKESSEKTVAARDELKAVIDGAVKLNSEYASMAYEAGVAEVKKTAKKAA